MGFFNRILNSIRNLFGRNTNSLGPTIPPIIDEVEVFENILLSALPINWTFERRNRRSIGPLGLRSTTPYLSDWNRYWVLSTPWPGNEPQRVQIHLYLIREIGTLHNDKEHLTNWERFSVVAQNPSVIQINNQSFTWATLPGWPNAKDDIINSLM